jgi:hypothetical protein
VRTAATTAVIAGTATAVSGAVAGHQQSRHQAKAHQQMADQAAFESQQQVAELQAQIAAMQAQQAPAAMTAAPPPSAAPAPGTDVMTQLQQLAQMKSAGLLNDAEFEAAKAKLLGL